MKGSWGDKSAVLLARGTRSLRVAGLGKRGGRFPFSKHRCFPALLASSCSHTQRTWPAGPSSNHRLWAQCRKGTQDPLYAECQRQAASERSLLTPPHPCIPCWNPYHSTTAWTPTSDPPWVRWLGPVACVGFPELLPPCSSHRTAGSWHEGSLSPESRSLCFPRPASWPWNDTRLLSCPLLSLTHRWEQNHGWNGTGGKPNGQNLILKKWVFHREGIESKNRPKYIWTIDV